MLRLKKRGAQLGIMRRSKEEALHMMIRPHANRLLLPDLVTHSEVLGSAEEEGEAEEEGKLNQLEGLSALRLESTAKECKILKLTDYLGRGSLKQSKSNTRVILIQNKNFQFPIVSQ